jgi:hypothetical protein
LTREQRELLAANHSLARWWNDYQTEQVLHLVYSQRIGLCAWMENAPTRFKGLAINGQA